MGLIVVTNPELGWDCVVAVYDDSEVSEKELKNSYNTDVYVLTSIGLTSFTPKDIDYDEIEEIIATESKSENNIELIIDNLEIVSDHNSLLQSNEGMKLSKIDIHILGNILTKFASDKNIELKGNFCVVTVPAGRYTSYDFSYLGFKGSGLNVTFFYEMDDHLKSLGIDLS